MKRLIFACMAVLSIIVCLYVNGQDSSPANTGTAAPVQAQHGDNSSFTNSIGMKFVLIPAGEFMMGSEKKNEGPGNNVKITEPFFMQTTEVTQEQWTAVMGNNPSNFKGDDLPVECVSWNDVHEFIKKLNEKEQKIKYRLPSEEEWEYACRAGSTGAYCFGNNVDELADYAWYCMNTNRKTHPVGQKEPNKWGLYDMHGNVREWCEDVFRVDRLRSGQIIRTLIVARGGDFGLPAEGCLSSYQTVGEADRGKESIGFRICTSSKVDISSMVETKNVLFLDNGQRIVGELISENVSTVVFRERKGEKREIILLPDKDFFRLGSGASFKANPFGRDMDEDCIAKALSWLSRHQTVCAMKNPKPGLNEDSPEPYYLGTDNCGYWDVKFFNNNCKQSKCGGASENGSNVIATGLSLLSMIGNGHTPRIGEFQKFVKNGVTWLLDRQDNSGCLADPKSEFLPLEHAIATMALGEYYAITKDFYAKKPVDNAVAILLSMQNPDGGWSVNIGGPSTTTGTAWTILALKAAKTGGIEVAKDSFDRARAWLEKATDESGNVSETLPGGTGKAGIVTSPIGRCGMSLTGRIFCGEKRSNLAKISDRIMQLMPELNPSSPTYCMDLYFCTYGLYQIGGKAWPKWKISHNDLTLPTQRQYKCAYGSWDEPNTAGLFADRITSTALATLSWEIRGRYERIRARDPKSSEDPEETAPKPQLKVIGMDEILDQYSMSDLIADAATDNRWDWRCRAVFMLGEKFGGNQKAQKALVAALKDADDFVRANAVREIGRNKLKSAAEELAALAKDPSPFVKRELKTALELLK